MEKNAETPAPTAAHPLRKRRVITITLGVLIAVVLAWLLFVPDPLPVEVTTVARGSMQVTVNNQGQVRVRDRYIVAAPVAGELQRIDLREGDRVQRGQPVATLDPLPLDARQRQEATARIEGAKALAREAALQVRRAATELQLAVNERKRVEQLVKNNFISPQAAERTRSAEQSARAAWNAAKSREQAAIADIKAAEAALLAAGKPAAASGRELQLTAPVDGYVLTVNEKSARTVQAGAPLLAIADPSRYEVVVDVLSADAVKVDVGDTMLLEDWGGGRTLRARVRLVEPVAFTKISALGVEEQRVNVIADPVDTLGPLGDGYRIEARIVIWSADDVLKVAGSSLFRVGDAWHVFVIEDGRVHERVVKTGRRNQDEVQILDGLHAGTSVVRYPDNQLQDGARVTSSSTAGTP